MRFKEGAHSEVGHITHEKVPHPQPRRLTVECKDRFGCLVCILVHPPCCYSNAECQLMVPSKDAEIIACAEESGWAFTRTRIATSEPARDGIAKVVWLVAVGLDSYKARCS